MNAPTTQEIANRFSDVAERFCATVEEAERIDRNSFLLRIYRVLPELIGAALHLPEVEPTDAATCTDSVRISHVEWTRIYNGLAAALGDWDSYWQTFDPTKNDEPVAGSLADDFADIYRDLHEGITLKETHRSLPVDIIWQWRLSFYSHWGKHAIDALQVTHCRVSEMLM